MGLLRRSFIIPNFQIYPANNLEVRAYAYGAYALTRGLHGSDIHMDIHMVMDKCWIWIGFYRIDGYGYG